HRDVQNETSSPVHAIGREKSSPRRKGTGFETKLLKQVGQRLAHGLIVVDHGHERPPNVPRFLAGLHNLTVLYSIRGVHYTLVLVWFPTDSARTVIRPHA